MQRQAVETPYLPRAKHVKEMITDDQQQAETRAVNLSPDPATNLTTASKIDQPLAPVHLNQKLSTLETNGGDAYLN